MIQYHLSKWNIMMLRSNYDDGEIKLIFIIFSDNIAWVNFNLYRFIIEVEFNFCHISSTFIFNDPNRCHSLLHLFFSFFVPSSASLTYFIFPVEKDYLNNKCYNSLILTDSFVFSMNSHSYYYHLLIIVSLAN